MAAFEEELQSYLETDPGVSALVEDHIYPVRRPEKSPIPAVEWRRVDASRVYTHTPFIETDAWVQTRIQVDCWAYTFTEALNVGNAVLAALSGYEGGVTGTLIQSSMAVDEADSYEADTKFYRRRLDFRMMYEDAVTGS